MIRHIHNGLVTVIFVQVLIQDIQDVCDFHHGFADYYVSGVYGYLVDSDVCNVLDALKSVMSWCHDGHDDSVIRDIHVRFIYDGLDDSNVHGALGSLDDHDVNISMLNHLLFMQMLSQVL